MQTTFLAEGTEIKRVEPLCPVFGICGGCRYQDIPYEDELKIKEALLKNYFNEQLAVEERVFDPILSSPKPYHYRNRLDVTLLKTKREGIRIGFSPGGALKVVPVDACPIAQKEISDFLPELKRQAESKLPPDYRVANLVIKTGDDGRIFWGGIGKRSLVLKPENYLWTEIEGKRISYSLDTFFQANLSILPQVVKRIRSLDSLWSDETILFDLYGGVGFFGICLADRVKKVVMIEDSVHSLKLARFNLDQLGSTNITICPGKVETEFPLWRDHPEYAGSANKVAFIDPPRAGLSPTVLAALTAAKDLKAILYLSCHPESLIRDLGGFIKEQWEVKRVMPMDFFPKTRHIETLVWLKPK